MRRILMVLTAAALMASMMVASAMPAFAQGKSEFAPSCEGGQFTAADNHKKLGGAIKHFIKAFEQCGTKI